MESFDLQMQILADMLSQPKVALLAWQHLLLLDFYQARQVLQRLQATLQKRQKLCFFLYDHLRRAKFRYRVFCLVDMDKSGFTKSLHHSIILSVLAVNLGF